MKILTVIGLITCVFLTAPSEGPIGLSGSLPIAHASTHTPDETPEAGRRHRSVTVYGAMW